MLNLDEFRRSDRNPCSHIIGTGSAAPRRIACGCSCATNTNEVRLAQTRARLSDAWAARAARLLAGPGVTRRKREQYLGLARFPRPDLLELRNGDSNSPCGEFDRGDGAASVGAVADSGRVDRALGHPARCRMSDL